MFKLVNGRLQLIWKAKDNCFGDLTSFGFWTNSSSLSNVNEVFRIELGEKGLKAKLSA
jgi:hypothetical protein